MKKTWHQRADDAANYLAETDIQIAELRVKWERDKRKAKGVWSAIFHREKGTVEDRKAVATTHPEFETAEAAEMTSLLEYEKIKNRRETACTVIDFWRSWNKAVQEGHI